MRWSPHTHARGTSRNAVSKISCRVCSPRARRGADGEGSAAAVVTGRPAGPGRRAPGRVRGAGAGTLAAAGSGNPHNVDSFRRPRHHAWHGRALAILRPAKTPGPVTLVASAPGLRPAKISLPVREKPVSEKR
ncbi:hypothetical protein [Actinoplanes subtropicus]|uniref:hypothetical protein n=1 Tax=Actinoplanes subtropicus TaxID=543632 RepID=UPI000B000DB8|nr:hypothetical protein [Actinoplanes subtropicus]